MHETVYSAVRDLSFEGELVDAVMVSAALQKSGDLSRVRRAVYPAHPHCRGPTPVLRVPLHIFPHTDAYPDTYMYSECMRTTDAPPPRLTRKESQEETRQRLIASAIALFAENGVAATSLSAIAEHAGYTRGAVHGNYAGKDALLAAVAETVVGELAPQLERILRAPEPSGTRLAAYIRTFLGYCARSPQAAGALIAVVAHLGRETGRHYAGHAAASLADLIELFEDGQRRGEMRAFDPWTMAFALRTVLDNAAAHLRTGDADADALATEIAALFAAATRREETA